MKSKRKLRNYLLNDMQLKLSVKYLVVAILSCILTGLVVYISLWPVITDYVPQAVVERLEIEFRIRLVGLGIPLAVVALGAYIVISHQVLGPLQKIMIQIEKIAKGDKDGVIRIRNTDVLMKPYADKLNEFVKTIRDKR